MKRATRKAVKQESLKVKIDYLHATLVTEHKRLFGKSCIFHVFKYVGHSEKHIILYHYVSRCVSVTVSHYVSVCHGD